jgi:threonine aldolase
MRLAMAHAEVGDDVYGEDPTVNALQERVAAIVGKAAALFVPTGSMANQIALMAYTRPGDDVIIGWGAHNYFYEGGAGGALAGVQFTVVGQGGLYSAEDAAREIKADNHHFAPTRLLCIENTHNRAGGKIFPIEEVRKLRALAHGQGIPLHMDGARLFNAAVAAGVSARTWAEEVDSLSICLSKGLGAPVGSVLAGSEEFIWRCHRYRKMMGGGMRQAGILAAAGLYALENNIARLADDHQRARALANGLSQSERLSVLGPVETNIVIFDIPGDAARLVARAKEQGVLLNAIGAKRVRAVTHLDLDDSGIEHAVRVLLALSAED